MNALKMIAIAFFASLLVAACEPAGDGGQLQEPAAPSGSMQ